MPSSHRPGRHELGQNFLIDRQVIETTRKLVSQLPGPIVEWGAGDGAVTSSLARLNRPLQGIEIDPERARALDRRLGPHVSIRHGDILRHAPPRGAIVVSNVPFHITTKVLRHLLNSPQWSHAVLITQWEVARKRAGVGGATQLTAQSWPWYEFDLVRRIPATAFRPVPTVDGGLFSISRRAHPLIPVERRKHYRQWVADVFSSRGRGLHQILARAGVPSATASKIASQPRGARGAKKPVLPRDMTAQQWAQAYLGAWPNGRRHR
ncbi:MAG TPA: 23S ribosomal RNA methyltransferase Erm [Candidatus Nesterenkonia stercoripullorum]|uniref:23S ribosomal RNA methyltransferase Erm n=1 Tax=Candidatus Nesterenkonia stercoripullorum TaxID=2838701 RepID=A0A9D1UTV2_9MICC|nr:23S ribosomal RNA methyltransferase Erm [Candidatus Nesterenkonia stercoripullorum]